MRLVSAPYMVEMLRVDWLLDIMPRRSNNIAMAWVAMARKRYPIEARSRAEQSTARLSFSIDHEGHLLSSRIVTSSGSAALDAETLAPVRRAQPFPPPELAGSEMKVPLRFNIR
jgi:TonB family protein